MDPLSPLGWTPSLAAALETLRRDAPSLRPARVCAEHRGAYRVLLAPGDERSARLAGRLRRDSPAAADLPAVGDWAAVEVPPGGGDLSLRALLPRRTALLRKEAGTGVGAQVLAANVNTVLVTLPLDRGVNPRLLERALALAWDGGADPVVLLTKADLDPDPGARAREAAAACPGAPVLPVSAATGDGVAALAAWLRPGSTACLLGPSGAGKSTLANRLLGAEAMATGEVREGDGRGCHTTVHRELLLLASGALLVDTPGLREIALFAAEEGIASVFADIEALARECSFRDCRHGTEPGCAVLAAEAEGRLDPARLEGWRRLGREEAHLARKAGVEALWEAKRRRRRWGRILREAKDDRRSRRGEEA
jgi:ribosome biogenesis GTPase